MLYPLIFNDEVRAAVKRLVAEAHASPIGYATLLAMAAKHARGERIEGLNTDQTINLPQCYVVTYTVEEHLPGTLYRHISLSIVDGKPGRGPTPEALSMVLDEFGFQGGLSKCHIQTEVLPAGNIAVGAIQPVC